MSTAKSKAPAQLTEPSEMPPVPPNHYQISRPKLTRLREICWRDDIHVRISGGVARNRVKLDDTKSEEAGIEAHLVGTEVVVIENAPAMQGKTMLVPFANSDFVVPW